MKYKTLSFCSALIPIPILDIVTEYKVREFMFDKIAKMYQEFLEDKIPDNYKDPDVRKIVAKASKYTYLDSDGNFHILEKYKDIYEKLKKNNDNQNNDNKIINDNIINTDPNEMQPLLLDEINIKKKNANNENPEEEEIKKFMEMKKNFEINYYKNEEHKEEVDDIQQTSCSKLKGFGNIMNDIFKCASYISSLGTKQIIQFLGKEINQKGLSIGIPVVGHFISGSIFGAINIKSLENKINNIIKEIDESLTGKEDVEKIIAEKLINYFNILKNNYLKEFSKDGNNYDVEISGFIPKDTLLNK